MASTTKHISERIEFETIIAGVLRMITDYTKYLKYCSYIEPTLFYTSDNTPERSALRSVLTLMKALNDENKAEDFSFNSIAQQILLKYGDNGKPIREIFLKWTLTDEITTKVNDEGCFSIFVDYLKVLQIIKIGAEFNNSLQSNRVFNAIKVMKHAISIADQIDVDDIGTFAPGEMLKIIRENSASKKSVFHQTRLLLGQPLIDEVTGGFEVQTLTGFISVSGGGKSLMGHHLIYRCIKQKTRVWVAILEDRKTSFTYRLLSRMTGISLRRLKESELTTEEELRLRDAQGEIDKFVKVQFIYSANIDTIHKCALDYDLECDQRGWPKPVVNIVDYTGHISGRSTGDKMFEKIRAAYGARKDFVLKNNKIGFDFAQINREGSKGMASEKLITQNDLAGAYDLIQVFDNMISINRSAEDVAVGRCRLHMCKARDAMLGVTVSVATNFGCASYEMDKWECDTDNLDIKKMVVDLKAKVQQ